jgi:hypothetical protein
MPTVALFVTAVQEVHEGAGQQEQIRQDTEDVSGVLGDEEEPYDCEKHQESKP